MYTAQGTNKRISLEFARLTVCEPKLKPGSYLCVECKTHATNFHKAKFFQNEFRSPENSDQEPEAIGMMVESNDEFVDSQEIRNSTFNQLDQVAAFLDKSPLISATKRLSSEQRNVVASKQLKKIVPALAEKVALAYKVSTEDFNDIKQLSEDYEDLITEIKSCFIVSKSLIERKQLLILLLKSWNYEGDVLL